MDLLASQTPKLLRPRPIQIESTIFLLFDKKPKVEKPLSLTVSRNTIRGKRLNK